MNFLSNPPSLILFLVTGAIGAAANLTLKYAVDQLGNFSLGSIPDLFRLLTNFYTIIGLFLYALSSVLYLKLLAESEITRSYPAIVGYMFVIVLCVGLIFFKETASIVKILGVFVIGLGILMTTL